MANRSGARWRGKLVIPQHVHPLVRALFEEANKQRTTIQEIADRAGIRRGTISEWRHRRMPRIDLLEAAFNVLDCTLVVNEKRD